jgi:hypothetical protein
VAPFPRLNFFGSLGSDAISAPGRPRRWYSMYHAESTPAQVQSKRGMVHQGVCFGVNSRVSFNIFETEK